ncbi:very long chain fatty acid elongase 5-like [Tubulanus polymorphus]|uniref:very long chain fatty acid elongase 5-like n=1 Tax=Tubulanus polymorphus TaxID=672921 RepID=UPI003DA40CEA
MVSLTGLHKFLSAVVRLETFPTFITYLIVVYLARYWKKISRPRECRSVLMVYNFGCSALSLYTLYGFAIGLVETQSFFKMETSPVLQNVYFWYMVCKRIELLDTIFMILRHRERQLTFLHIYHHSSMLLLSDYCYHFTPWSAMAIFLALNSFVHVVLYLYYGLCAMGYQPPWKKQMTQIQIIQFLIGFLFSIKGYTSHGFCIYSIIYGMSMTALFGNFYYQAYHKKKNI